MAGERLAGWLQGAWLGALRRAHGLCCRVGGGSEQLWSAPGAAGGGKAPWLPRQGRRHGEGARQPSLPVSGLATGASCEGSPCSSQERGLGRKEGAGASAGRVSPPGAAPERWGGRWPGPRVSDLSQQHSPKKGAGPPWGVGAPITSCGRGSPRGATGLAAAQSQQDRKGGFIPSFPHEAARFAHPAHHGCVSSLSILTAVPQPCSLPAL